MSCGLHTAGPVPSGAARINHPAITAALDHAVSVDSYIWQSQRQLVLQRTRGSGRGAVLAQGLPSPFGVGCADVVVDRERLAPVRGGVRVAVVEHAISYAFQSTRLFQRRADFARDGQRLGVPVVGASGVAEFGQHVAQIVEYAGLAASI